jgi:hypothetical protein
MEMSVEESVKYFSAEPASLKESRLHWYSCPSCRITFPEAEAIMKSVRRGIEQWAMTTLSQICEKHLIEENPSPSPETDPREFYAAKLASLMVHEDMFHDEDIAYQHHESDVQWALGYAVEGLRDFTVRCDTSNAASQRVPLRQCTDFINSLSPKAQSFVFASVLCHEMYYQLYRKALRKTQETLFRVDPETEHFISINNDEYEHPYDANFIHGNIKNAIMDSEVPPEIAYQSVLAAASDYLRRFRESIGETLTGDVLLQDHSGKHRASTNIAVDEFKSDIADSFDSLKAGQNELLRLIERNSRPASAFEPDIEMQLGDVYGLLEDNTRQLLQIAEYLYDTNKSEPNYFHGPVMMMASAYENELKVRIVGRYALWLLKAGTRTYYCNEFATKPLIDGGRPRNLTLGNMLWYLKNDKRLGEWAQGTGFSSVDAIVDDAGWLTGIRNRAAHQATLERAVADEVRHRILQSDGMLARLFTSDREA